MAADGSAMSAISGAEMYLDGRVALHHGDSRDVLRAYPDGYFHAVVCDPPYALVSIVKRFGGEGAKPARDGDVYSRASAGFMGQRWDTGETAFASAFWAEVLRVLKPGGWLIAASGTRTYHRLACAIEDAGFEIRDMLSWLYGSGFPKSHDVAKAIDRRNGDERPVVGKEILSNDIRGGALLDAAHGGERPAFERDITVAASAVSAAWEGWGTALKPACEPWVLGRKPMLGTVAENVLAHGTGALNIDRCRVGSESRPLVVSDRRSGNNTYGDGLCGSVAAGKTETGRWPANVLHDGSDDVISAFPETASGTGAIKRESAAGRQGNALGRESRPAGTPMVCHGDAGSAARFFYTAKADGEDRFASRHPTVKPLDLMQYFVRLVTPPGGVVLDPFAGSGTTGEAAWREGFSAVLIEREAAYADDIRRRLQHANSGPDERRRVIAKAAGKTRSADDLPLFGGE